MRYTVLFCSKTGAKRVNPGQARSGSHTRRPTPRRLSVFCSTTLGIQISNGHAEPVFAKNGHSANSPIRQAGEVQCLGEMPSPGRVTALRTDPHQVSKTGSGSIALRDGLAEGPPRPRGYDMLEGWSALRIREGGRSLLCWADADHPNVLGHGFR